MQYIASTIFSCLPKTPAIRGSLPTRESSLCQKISRLSAIIFLPFLWLDSLCSSFYQRAFSILFPKKPGKQVPPPSPKNDLKKDLSRSSSTPTPQLQPIHLQKDLALLPSEDDVEEEPLGSPGLLTPQLSSPATSPISSKESMASFSLTNPPIPPEKEEMTSSSSEDEIDGASLNTSFCEEEELVSELLKNDESIISLPLPNPPILPEKEEMASSSSEDEIDGASLNTPFCEKEELVSELLKNDESIVSLPLPNPPIPPEKEEMTSSSSEDEIDGVSLNILFYEEEELESEVLKTSAVAQAILIDPSLEDPYFTKEEKLEKRQGVSSKKRVMWAEGIKDNEKKPKPHSPPAPEPSRRQRLHSEFEEFFSNTPSRETEKGKEEEERTTINESSSSSSSSNVLSEAETNQIVSNILSNLEQQEGWQQWLSSYDYFGIGKTWTLTKEWGHWLGQQVHREPNPIHNIKYELALASLQESFKMWLISRNGCIAALWKEEINTESLVRNLEKRFAKANHQLTEDYSPSEWAFVQNAIHAIHILLNPPSTKSVREKNSNFLAVLRAALKSSSYKDYQFDELVQTLQALCWGKFTSNVMTTYEKRLLEKASGAPKMAFTSRNIATIIREGNRALKACDPAFRKALGDLIYQKVTNELDALSDPLGTSNIPEIRSIHTVEDESSKYDVIYMRHGTPTFAPDLSCLMARWTGNVSALVGLDTLDSNASNKAEIIPEYRGFLDAAKTRGSSILYVNHQDMTTKNTPEYNRSIMIELLQDEYPETFHFVALPFDGPIWKEIDQGTLSDWKDRILSALLNQTDGFRLPKDFAANPEVFYRIIQKIHELYFSEQKELSKENRTVFLSIFYSYIKEAVKAKYGVKVMVSACKDNKDRGNASSSIDEALFNLRLGRENDGKALEDLYIRTLAPFIVKYEEIIEHRLEPLFLLLEHIAGLSDEEKTKIREYSPVARYKILDQRVPYEDSPLSQFPESE